jgi:hypothetical protein
MQAPQPSSKPDRQLPSEASAGRARSSWTDRVAVALIVAIMLGLSGFGMLRAKALPVIPTRVDQDTIDDAQARDRARVFNTSTPLALRIVAPSELEQAMSTMGLDTEDQQALSSELRVAPSPAPQPEPAAADRRPLRLVWITLWDTHAQDGDVVRIDSSGFSTTVTLSNTPITFAVPIPEQGVINVTGIRDGGGWITIGAMSGVQRVALPVMSVGQVLGVPVVAR